MSFFSFESKTLDQKIDEVKDLIKTRKEYLSILETIKSQNCIKDLLNAYEKKDVVKLLSHPYGKAFLERIFESDEIFFSWDDDGFDIRLVPTCTDFMEYKFDEGTKHHVWTLYRYAKQFSSSIGNNCREYFAETDDALVRFCNLKGEPRTADDIMLEIVKMHTEFPYAKFPKEKRS
ncbi:hypothetical protein EVB55_143 [Rhizobium phage RHph_Y68]|uniref:Uncharacterized protein n=1 Tax=Rhizobium phage RHph_Y68 TaxID=2509787 RepID=A0A7S5UUG1_9CAUD|nr:hypothetical protein PP934_gp143 [Rhizobium phage RHph_Y68]QIG68078.1 hypothetical protein EVB55_143 [Rhizobium phage RHph_Y68]